MAHCREDPELAERARRASRATAEELAVGVARRRSAPAQGLLPQTAWAPTPLRAIEVENLTGRAGQRHRR